LLADLPGQIYQIVDSNPPQYLPQSIEIIDLKSTIVHVSMQQGPPIPGSHCATIGYCRLVYRSHLSNCRFQFSTHNLPKS
jgi:hypothetical protein